MQHEVCVVGSGGAGLAAARALKARGLPFRVFEARDAIGGMWRYGSTFAYASLMSNTSRYRTSFSTHRMSWRGAPYVHHREFLGYLESFADRFGLREHVELEAPVAAAEPRDGCWDVTVRGREPEPFRAVIAATGMLGHPRHRELPGQFAGRYLHSAEYRTPDEFAGQDVVVTGIGSSGADVAVDLIDHARSVTVAVRTGVWIVPRHWPRGVPLDFADTRLNSRLLPLSIRRAYVALAARRTMRALRRHGIPEPNHRLFDEPTTVSDRFVPALEAGRFDVRPGIERFDGETVHFADGSSRRADVVIACSGFDPGLEYLPDDLVAGYDVHHMPLYRGVAHRDVDGLFFIGLVIGPGALLPVMEAQAGWIAAVLAGELPWPSAAERAVGVAQDVPLNIRDFGRPHAAWRDRLRYVIQLEGEVRTARRRASRARSA